MAEDEGRLNIMCQVRGSCKIGKEVKLADAKEIGDRGGFMSLSLWTFRPTSTLRRASSIISCSGDQYWICRIASGDDISCPQSKRSKPYESVRETKFQNFNTNIALLVHPRKLP